MPVARFEMPDGRIARFEVAEGTTPEQAQAQIAQIIERGVFQQQEPPSTPADTIAGIGDIAVTTAAGLGKSAVEGIAGIGGLLMGKSAGESIEAAQAIGIPDVQLGEQGQALVQTISEKFQASPQMVQDIVNAVMNLGPSIGESVFQATGSPLAATAASILPEALEAATGLKGGKAVIKAAGDVATPAAIDVADIFTRQSPAKQKIAELIKSGSTDIDVARFKLDKPDLKGRPTVKADPIAKEALKQGFDEGVIAAVKGAKGPDKIKMLEMTSIMERSKKNARFAADNRPSDVLGESVMSRLRIVKRANKAAGQRLDEVAKSLKGKEVDFNPAIDSFVQDLDDIGITLSRNESGVMTPNFKGSDIEGLAGPEAAINRIVKRMTSDKTPDAFELHRMKKFIDEQVTFGKNAEGLAGKTESILKSLRRNLDQTLDTNFTEYDRINSAYAETISALDAFQEVAGKKMNLTGPNADKATGTLMRRVLSNAQSRITLLDSVNEIERVAKKFENFKSGKPDPRAIEGPKPPSKINDDLLNQVLFVDELDAQFGTTARTSFQGQIQQAAEQAAKAKISPVGAAIDLVAAGADKARNINDESAFKAIKELLRE